MKRRVNLLLVIAIVLLSALPLWLVQKPAPNADGTPAAEIFTGSDDKAKDMIGTLHPDYKPWFSPILEPASTEIASLLFALQAAIGAGVIGYYLGVSVTREKMRRETEKTQAEAANPGDAEQC